MVCKHQNITGNWASELEILLDCCKNLYCPNYERFAAWRHVSAQSVQLAAKQDVVVVKWGGLLL